MSTFVSPILSRSLSVEDVARQHHEVGQLAGLERAAVLLLKRRHTALPSVYASTASATVIRCSGNQPSGCLPSSVRRFTAASMPSSGSSGATGQSEPNASFAPASSSERKAYELRTASRRCAPRPSGRRR